MLNLLKQRKDRLELERYVAQVADMTNPHQTPLHGEDRKERRYARNFPILVAPLRSDGALQLDEAEVGLCKDLSAQGISIVFAGAFDHGEVVLGLWPTNDILSADSSRPGFLKGVVRQSKPMGGVFHQVGVEFQTLLDVERDEAAASLAPLLRGMLFPSKSKRD